ncbi:MAG TPA: alpha/beta hydrolase [Dermatophilaceae bacterium]|nr:alpha/beta hydrolase [Dermatophilaceae bacterium]
MSLGSFALQNFLLEHSGDLDAAALSGTTALDVLVSNMDPDAGADLSAFNAAFEPGRTGYEWLSRDEAEVDAYVADEDCGFVFEDAGLTAMFSGSARTSDPEASRAIRPDLPVYLLSGTDDPLAGGGQLVELVGQRYRDAGLADVSVRLYPGARHEVLNETNRDEVTADLLAWLDRVTAR